MVSIARKNLFQEKTRLFISVGGVTFAVFLILIIQALYQGWNQKMTQYIESLEGDIWILEEGTSDMFHSFSIVSQDLTPEISALKGVTDVRPFIGEQVGFEINGEKTSFFLVGFDTEGNAGGPVNMIKGERSPGPNEIVVDIVFAQNNDLDIGEQITIDEQAFTIVGLSEGGNMIVFQYSFVRQEDALNILQLGVLPTAIKPEQTISQPVVPPTNLANYLLVDVEQNQLQSVTDELSRLLPKHVIKSEKEFVEINQTLIRDSFLPIIYVLNIVGFLVGVAVIGLTIFTATIEKNKEYGVLKAIGTSNWSLLKIIIQQSFIAAALGFLIATGLAYAVSSVIPRFVPAFQTLIRPSDVIVAFLITILMSFVAAYFPIRRVMKLDPAKVFRA